MKSGLVVLLVMAIATLSSFLSITSASNFFHHEREEAARKWSPLVWLHPDENFFPSSVPFFLRHITPSRETRESQGQAVVQQGSAAPQLNLPSGRPGQDIFLLAPHNFGCLDCSLPGFLHGQKPKKQLSPPVYVTIHTCFAQPSARAVRSTIPTSLLDDDVINYETYTDNVPGDKTTTSSSHTDDRSTFSIKNPMPSFRNFFYSNHTYPLLNTSQLNQSQARKTHSLVPMLGVTNLVNISFEENATITSPSICLNNDSLCPTRNSDEETHNSTKSIQITLDAQNLTIRNMRLTDHLSSATEIPHMNESWTMIASATKFQNSSLIRLREHNTHANETYDLRKTKITSTGQYHNNVKRHTQPSTLYEQQYTVTYWMFYPYNRGKKICTVNLGYFLGRMIKPRLNGVCYGEEITMGNHVGDWEHISIQFSGNRPSHMYVSTHTFGAYYTYDVQNHRFVYEDEDTRKGIPLSPVYPKIIQLTGSHPILYSAKGSHGLWGAEGISQYNSLPILQDETRKGTPWETWINLKLIDLQNPISAQPHRHWWKYEGRWGNPSSKCHLMLAGFCEHVNGPTGIPKKRVDFPCRDL